MDVEGPVHERYARRLSGELQGIIRAQDTKAQIILALVTGAAIYAVGGLTENGRVGLIWSMFTELRTDLRLSSVIPHLSSDPGAFMLFASLLGLFVCAILCLWALSPRLKGNAHSLLAAPRIARIGSAMAYEKAFLRADEKRLVSDLIGNIYALSQIVTIKMRLVSLAILTLVGFAAPFFVAGLLAPRPG